MSIDPCRRYAAIGGPDSTHAVAMPSDHGRARDLKAAWVRFWCSTAIGGCGTELTARVSGDRIPHFAHRSGVRCTGLGDPRSHALAWEHLVMQHALQRWLESLGYDVELERKVVGGRVDVHVSTGVGEHVLEVQRSPLSVHRRVSRTELYSVDARTVSWLWDSPRRDGEADLQLRSDGIAFTTRLDEAGVVQVGTLWRVHDPADPAKSWDVGYDDLDTCDLDQHGLRTSHRTFALQATRIFLEEQQERDAQEAQRRAQERAQQQDARRQRQEAEAREAQRKRDREQQELENVRARLAAVRDGDGSPHSRPPAEWMPPSPVARRPTQPPPDKVVAPHTLAIARMQRPLGEWTPPGGWVGLDELPERLHESAKHLTLWVRERFGASGLDDLQWDDVPDPEREQVAWLLRRGYILLNAKGNRWLRA
ncbi:hypothetical protein KMZ32_01915 [Phycicoccus sp. MAQZ13P-2]|uniref:competence protein CoiA family protein n=1 Tax=Phycicoccus mangrovi TaxID=2840470 RepID=UPI001C003EE6|nr:competence protein CoiA family protein [Phycicoccus mangrovi]MBT9254449.1 hypothetical protein [Phycicoccus mangrovi]MBT9272827.1 hypothetical protein [Phycicoccus mangrovi]